MRTSPAMLPLLLLAMVLAGFLTQRSVLLGLASGLAAILVGLVPMWMERRVRSHDSPSDSKARGTSRDRRLALVITALPLAVGVGAVNSRASELLLILLGFAAASCIDISSRRPLELRCLVLASSVLYLLSIYRTESLNRSLTALLVALIIIGIWQSTLVRGRLFEAVMQSIAVYLLASIAAYYLLGLRSPAAANRLGGLESSFGFLSERVFLPFTNSMVLPAALASAYVCWFLPRAIRRHAWSPLTLAGFVAALFTMLATNYRVPIAVALTLGIFCSISPKIFRRCAAPLGLFVLLLPFWWHNGANPVRVVADGVKSETGAVFSRSDEAGGRDTATLNQRTLVWARAKVAFDDSPFEKRLFGYGVNGQAKSGASEGFYQVFNGFVGSRYAVLSHSTAWQTLLDAGLVGIAVLILLVVGGILAACAWPAAASASGLDGSPLLPLLALVASTGTEVTLAPGVGTEAFWVFALLVAVAIAGARKDAPSSEPVAALSVCPE